MFRDIAASDGEILDFSEKISTLFVLGELSVEKLGCVWVDPDIGSSHRHPESTKPLDTLVAMLDLSHTTSFLSAVWAL